MYDKMIEIMKSIDRQIANMGLGEKISGTVYDMLFHHIVADNCPNCCETKSGWGCNELFGFGKPVVPCSPDNCPKMKH